MVHGFKYIYRDIYVWVQSCYIFLTSEWIFIMKHKIFTFRLAVFSIFHVLSIPSFSKHFPPLSESRSCAFCYPLLFCFKVILTANMKYYVPFDSLQLTLLNDSVSINWFCCLTENCMSNNTCCEINQSTHIGCSLFETIVLTYICCSFSIYSNK